MPSSTRSSTSSFENIDDFVQVLSPSKPVLPEKPHALEKNKVVQNVESGLCI